MGFLFFIQSVFKDVGILVIPLFACLSIVFVILIERTLFLSFVFKRDKIIYTIKDIILTNKAYPKLLREDLIEIELEETAASLFSGLNLLKFIAGISTMLGLLGTVLGMIEVFGAISTIKTSVNPAMISTGIKQAMYTTAYGLTIGIFALTVHYVLSFIMDKVMLKIEEYASVLNVSKEYERLAEINKMKK